MTNWSKALVALTAATAMAMGAMLTVLDWAPYGLLSGVHGLYPGVVPVVMYLTVVLGPAARDGAKSAFLFWASLVAFLCIAAPLVPVFLLLIAFGEEAYKPICFVLLPSISLFTGLALTLTGVIARIRRWDKAAVVFLVLGEAAFLLLIYGELMPQTLFDADGLAEQCAKLLYP